MKEFTTLISNFINHLLNYLGGFDFLIQSLLIVLVLEIMSRIGAVIYNKKINITSFLMWFARNIGVFVVMVLGVLFDQILGDKNVVRDIVIYTFIINKVVGIIDMWHNMGLKMPKVIETTLENIKKIKQE